MAEEPEYNLDVEIVLRLRPERNPDLGLPDAISTRRGIYCGFGGGSLPSRADLIVSEVKGGLRALEHFVKRWQAGEVSVPDRGQGRLVRMSEGLFQELGASRIDWREPIGQHDTEPVYEPIVYRDELAGEG